MAEVILVQPLSGPLPAKTELAPYWRACMPALHHAYDGICAYLCIYIERVTGAASTDHFIAKSSEASLAYEWSNYRLACLAFNGRKREFNDVLDPFLLRPDLMHLELSTGRIFPNPALSSQPDLLAAVNDTIRRLELDDPLCRETRARHFQEYVQKDVSEDYLRRRSPFVWFEASRQNLL